MQLIIEYNTLTDELKYAIKDFIANFNYVNITLEQIISVINNSIKLKQLCNKEELDTESINEFQIELFNIFSTPIKEALKNGDYTIILNYIEKRLKNIQGIIESIYELDRLKDFFDKFEIDITPEIINNLLKSSKTLSETVERLYKRSQQHKQLKDQFSDFVTNLIDISLMLEIDADIIDEDLDEEELAKLTQLAQRGDYYSNDFVHQLIVESHRYPLLTSEETNELIYQYRGGSKYAFEKLMLHNSRLVINIAKSHFGRGLEMLDLIQEGNLGLVKGIERYNPELGFRFSTYVTWWIKQTIRRALADHSRTIRIPVHMHEELIRYRKVVEELRKQLDREPTIAEIAKKMGIPQNKALSLYNYNTEALTISINTPVGDDDKGSDLTTFIPADSSNFTEEILRNINSEEIRTVLDKINLTSREREVLFTRYELDGEDKKRLRELGEKFNVTRERIRQIEVKAIEKILLSQYARELCELSDNPDAAWQRVLLFREIRAEKALNGKRAQSSKVNPIQVLNDVTQEQSAKKEGDKMKILSLTELFNQTKEELISIIAKLPEDDQTLIAKLYDEDYNPRIGVKRTPEESHRWTVSIVKTIRKYIMDPDYVPVVKNKPFYHEIGISLEVFQTTVLPILAEEEKTLIKKYYDSEYKRNKTPWNPEDKKEIKKMARKYQPKIAPAKPIVEETRPRKANNSTFRGVELYTLLKIDIEKLYELIKKLTEEEQNLIKKYYDEEYKRKSIPFTKEDGAKFYGSIYQKLKKMVGNPNYTPKSKTPSRTNEKTAPTNTTKQPIPLNMNNLSQDDNQSIPKQPTEKVNPLGEITINIQNQQVLNQLSPLVNIIVALRTKYSTEAIATYLQLDEDVVRNILRQYLISCKESLNMIFEDLITSIDNENIKLERKKDEN